MVCKDGSIVCGLGSILAHKDDDGKVVRTHGFFTDITERKKMENELRKMTLAMEQSVDGIAIFDAQHKISFANNAFAGLNVLPQAPPAHEQGIKSPLAETLQHVLVIRHEQQFFVEPDTGIGTMDETVAVKPRIGALPDKVLIGGVRPWPKEVLPLAHEPAS